MAKNNVNKKTKNKKVYVKDLAEGKTFLVREKVYFNGTEDSPWIREDGTIREERLDDFDYKSFVTRNSFKYIIDPENYHIFNDSNLVKENTVVEVIKFLDSRVLFRIGGYLSLESAGDLKLMVKFDYRKQKIERILNGN